LLGYIYIYIHTYIHTVYCVKLSSTRFGSDWSSSRRHNSRDYDLCECKFTLESATLVSLLVHRLTSLTFVLDRHVYIKSLENIKFYGSGVDSASNRNEYQVYFLGVKAAGA